MRPSLVCLSLLVSVSVYSGSGAGFGQLPVCSVSIGSAVVVLLHCFVSVIVTCTLGLVGGLVWFQLGCML